MDSFCFIFLNLKGEKEMKKPDLTKFLKGVTSSAVKHSPEILTGLGIAGFVSTAVLVGKATPTALDIIATEKRRRTYEHIEESVTKKDVLKLTWKCYVPAVTLGALSTVCLIGASSVNTRRTAALATAYKISETALTEYRDKVIEVVGEKKEKVIRDKVAEEQLKKISIKDTPVIITNKGDTLCLESLSGRLFRADVENIKKAENKINLALRNHNYISLNSVYDEFGLSHNRMGDELGWDIDRCGYLDIEKSAQLTEDDEPCFVIGYSYLPEADYNKF